MTGGFFFIMWIASGTIQGYGVTTGSLSQTNVDDSPRACQELKNMQKNGIEAHLFKIQQSNYCVCDWGCECHVDVVEQECRIETTPAIEKTITVPR